MVIITLYKLHNKLCCESRLSLLSQLSCRASRAHRVERVEPCCLTSSTQPKCMGSTCRMCRVETWWAKWNLDFSKHDEVADITTTFYCSHFRVSVTLPFFLTKQRNEKYTHTEKILF